MKGNWSKREEAWIYTAFLLGVAVFLGAVNYMIWETPWWTSVKIAISAAEVVVIAMAFAP